MAYTDDQQEGGSDVAIALRVNERGDLVPPEEFRRVLLNFRDEAVEAELLPDGRFAFTFGPGLLAALATLMGPDQFEEEDTASLETEIRQIRHELYLERYGRD